MTPQNITRQNVIQAFDFINQNNIPNCKGSRTCFVQHNKNKYPPKYTISIANVFANGDEWDSKNFITTEARNRLTELGFIIGHY
jgi:5-methylcytosine-specific restriction protein A